jgi:D-methionine transport system substrate-binding protein
MSTESSPGGLREQLGQSKRKRNITIIVAVIVVLVVAALITVWSITARGQDGDSATGNGSSKSYKLSIAVSEDSSFQDAVSEVAAEKNLTIDWVNVDDWVLPNTELVAGNVDGNAFQHILYLSAFNEENDADLTPVFSTSITQWGIFSASRDEVGDIPEGGTVGIPDDPSNGGRALGILEAADLITLADDVGEFPTTDDIVSNPHKLRFKELAAKTIPQQFDDPSLDAVVVGLSYFDPSQDVKSDDALFLDDSLADRNLPYLNVVATTREKADNPAWKVLKEAYSDPRAVKALKEESFGATELVDVDVKELRAQLKELQAEAADLK